jgi:hypothetical protein
MPKLSPELSNLQVNNLESFDDPDWVTVTANQLLWSEDTGYTPAAFALERVLWSHGLTFDQYDVGGEEYSFIFHVNRHDDQQNGSELTREHINHSMAEIVSRSPTVRIKEHGYLPGLFNIHRGERILCIAGLAIEQLSCIQAAEIRNPSATDNLYKPGTFMTALVKPDCDMELARTEIECILTA